MTAPALEPTSGPVVQLASSVVPRRLIGGALSVAAGAAMALAAFVPWVTGAAAGTLVRGVNIDADGVGTVGSRAGWSGGDGLVFVISGVLLACVGAMTIARRYRVWHRPVLAGAAVVATAWMWMDVSELGSVPGPDGSTLDLGTGFGPVLVGLAVVLALAAAVLIPGDLVGRTWHAARVALRLDRIGLTRDSLEIRQRNLRSVLRHPNDSSLEPGDIGAMFADVCTDQAFHGHYEPARANARLLIDWVEQRHHEDPSRLDGAAFVGGGHARLGGPRLRTRLPRMALERRGGTLRAGRSGTELDRRRMQPGAGFHQRNGERIVGAGLRIGDGTDGWTRG